jgi:ABC-type dipeptide/oligopeptide/nickel transport system permease subunit
MVDFADGALGAVGAVVVDVALVIGTRVGLVVGLNGEQADISAHTSANANTCSIVPALLFLLQLQRLNNSIYIYPL